MGKVTQEMCGNNDVIQAVTEQLHKDIEAKLISNLEEAIKSGEMETDNDPEVLAQFIHSSWQGALLRIKSSRDKITLDHFHKVLVEVLLK